MKSFDSLKFKLKKIQSDIKKEFNFQTGSGVAQFDLKNIFTKKDCKEIYNKFGSNLNWIIRDSQHLILPNSQLLYAKKIKNFMINFCEIVQKNIPEKNLIKLKIETLRVARSDGTQHQVGARWHQDHEAYFSLLINLNDYADPMASTRFYHLQHNEKYNLDKLGNPVISGRWKQDFIKPFHLGIFNSGVRYFIFPKDKCRPISHIAPLKINKRLAIFATFTISGIEQGMDLKDIYIPLSISKKKKKQQELKILRREWRSMLGINYSQKKFDPNLKVRSELENSLYNLNSINFKIKSKSIESNYRMVDFGLKQFQHDKKIKNNKLQLNSLMIGELSRTLVFFNQIKDFILNKIKKQKNYKEIRDIGIYKNNNYNLYLLFKNPQKPFQLLKFKDFVKQIDHYTLVVYPNFKNFFFKDLKYFTNKKKKNHFINQNLYVISNLKKVDQNNYFFVKQILKKIPDKINISQVFNNNTYNSYLNYKKINKNKVQTDIVPFYLPRYGLNRLLPDINISSKKINHSKKILKK